MVKVTEATMVLINTDEIRQIRKAGLQKLADRFEASVALSKDWQGAIDEARSDYCTDEIEIDELPAVSESDNGVWIGAWVWVSRVGD